MTCPIRGQGAALVRPCDLEVLACLDEPLGWVANVVPRDDLRGAGRDEVAPSGDAEVGPFSALGPRQGGSVPSGKPA